MSSQADSLGIANSGEAARGTLGLSASDLAVYPFEQWQAAWQRLQTFQEGAQHLSVLLGDAGTGKSTMLEQLAKSLADSGKSVARLRGAQVDGLDFFLLASISLGLNLTVDDPQLAEAQLQEHLRAKSAQGGLYLLVDDADMLGPFALASLLRLADLPLLEGFPKPAAGIRGPYSSTPKAGLGSTARGRAPSSQALPVDLPDASDESSAGGNEGRSTQTGLKIVLAGPNRLLDLLEASLLDPRNESHIGRVTLGALSNAEMGAYLAHGLARTKENGRISIPNEVAAAIHHYSRGIPRMANHIATRLLFLASERSSQDVTANDVMEVVADLQSGGMLDKVPPLREPTLDRTHIPTAHALDHAGTPEIADEIDKSVAELVASELRKVQPEGRTGSAVPRGDEVARSGQPVLPAKVPKNYPWSALTPRQAWLLVPSFGLVVVLLSVVVGLKFLNEESPISVATRQTQPESENQVAAAAAEAEFKSPNAASVKPTNSAATPLSVQPPDFQAQLQRGSSGAEPRIALVPEVKSEQPTIEEPLVSAPNRAVGPPPKLDDLALNNAPAAEGMGGASVPPIPSADESERALPGLTAGEALGGIGNSDKTQPSEAPVPLVSEVGEPDTALALPSPTIESENMVRLDNVDKALAVERPGQLGASTEASDSTLALTPSLALRDNPTERDELDSVAPAAVPEQLASAREKSDATLPLPRQVVVDELTGGNEIATALTLESPDQLTSSEVSEASGPVLPSPTDDGKLTAPEEVDRAQSAEAPLPFASAVEDSDSALPASPPPASGDMPTTPGESDMAAPVDEPPPLASAAEISDTALLKPPLPEYADMPAASGEADKAALLEAPPPGVSGTENADAALPAPLPPANDKLAAPRETDTAWPEETPTALAFAAQDADPGLARPTTPPADNKTTRRAELGWPEPVESSEQVEFGSEQLAEEPIDSLPSADSNRTFPSVADPETATAGSQPTAVDESQQQDATGPSQIALLSRETTRSEAPDASATLAEDLRIQELLRAAQLDMQNNRLTTPTGNNAFEHYRSVLDIDPENQKALEGFEEIVRTYVVLVQRARAEGELELALRYLDRADKVLPEFEETVNLRRQISGELDPEITPEAGQDQPDNNLPTRERFIILPVRTSAECAWPFDQHITSAVRNAIERTALQRVLSAPSSPTVNGVQEAARFWSGVGPNEVPNARRVFNHGQQIGARWVLLSRIDCPASATIFEPWRDFQLHLFDVKRGVYHQQTGTLGEIASITERVLLANVAVNGG